MTKTKKPRIPKRRNLEAKELWTPKYRLRVVALKNKVIPRKSKHKGKSNDY